MINDINEFTAFRRYYVSKYKHKNILSTAERKALYATIDWDDSRIKEIEDAFTAGIRYAHTRLGDN